MPVGQTRTARMNSVRRTKTVRTNCQYSTKPGNVQEKVFIQSGTLLALPL
jgi:hypothetical protein